VGFAWIDFFDGGKVKIWGFQQNSGLPTAPVFPETMRCAPIAYVDAPSLPWVTFKNDFVKLVV
jgi:hypothetical protein